MNARAERPSMIVVGSTMIDMVAYLARVPARGETLFGTSFVQGFGGKGANQAVMASRLGATVEMVNCLGEDTFGDLTLENLRREGIGVGHITRSTGTATGVAFIWVEPNGDNRIVVVPGANDSLTREQAHAAVSGADRVDLVLGQLEVPQLGTAAGFTAARERGAITVLNPAPAAPLDSTLLAVTDWLTPNEVEFLAVAAACGVESSSVDDATIAAVAAHTGLRLAVTLGERGAAICDDKKDVVRIPAPAVDAVDTTGAGDAFVAAFCYGLATGAGAPQAAALGCACASSSVTRHGTQTSFPVRREAAGLLRRLSGPDE
jgi:ribokinase